MPRLTVLILLLEMRFCKVSNTIGACRDTCHKCIYCGTSCHVICGSETIEGGAVVCHCCQPHVHTVNAPSIRPNAGSISANTGIHNIDSLTTQFYTQLTQTAMPMTTPMNQCLILLSQVNNIDSLIQCT